MLEDFAELTDKLTETAKASFKRAQEIAGAENKDYIGTEHLLLGVLDQDGSMGAKILESRGVTFSRVETTLNLTPQALIIMVIQDGISQEIVQTLHFANMITNEFGQKYIGTEHLIYGLLMQKNARATKLLQDMKINITILKNELEQIFDRQYQESIPSKNTYKTQGASILHKFGVDLTAKAAGKMLDPVVGRDKEIERIITILGRRTKNNPTLIGEPGVGKTAIVEGLAQRIISGKVPEFLRNTRIMRLDLLLMISGTKYRGEFEERVQKVIDILKKRPEIIVFIDEIHMLVGAGAGEGSIDAANILKPSLARGEIKLIGATTFDEYRKYIEKDSALTRRLQTVVVREPTTDEAFLMMRGLSKQLEKHHNLQITDEVLKKAIDLADRYVVDRHLPDKAIDVIDEAASLMSAKQPTMSDKYNRYQYRIKLTEENIENAIELDDYELASDLKIQLTNLRKHQKMLKRQTQAKKQLDEKYLRQAVAAISDIPLANINKEELSALAKLENELNRQIIGQKEAVAEIAQVIKKAKSGLSPSNRPLGSFLLMGPTGVGKTELAKILAKEVFGGEQSLVKIDMSELSEGHTASRLIGAPAGYIGYGDSGTLTDKIRRRPHSVVLLDEIEKAHPDILKLLLQLLEEGQLTDGMGRVVSFRQTLIILTSNAGASSILPKETLGFQAKKRSQKQSTDKINQQSLGALKKIMPPELLNRFDNIITFKALTRRDISKIFDLLMKETILAVARQKRILQILPSAKKLLVTKAWEENMGARPLRRLIEQQITSKLADTLISQTSQENDILEIGVKKGEINIHVKQ